MPVCVSLCMCVCERERVYLHIHIVKLSSSPSKIRNKYNFLTLEFCGSGLFKIFSPNSIHFHAKMVQSFSGISKATQINTTVVVILLSHTCIFFKHRNIYIYICIKICISVMCKHFTR